MDELQLRNAQGLQAVHEKTGFILKPTKHLVIHRWTTPTTKASSIPSNLDHDFAVVTVFRFSESSNHEHC